MAAFVGGSAGATPTSDPCRGPDVYSLSVPIDPSSPGPRIDLRYKHVRVSDAQPTIVFVSSGPGNSAIFDYPSADALADDFYLPRGKNYLLPEYRGAGCNSDTDARIPGELYRTEVLAADYVAIIRHLKLDHYVLFASAYGSALAPVILGQLRDAGLPLPRAVLATSHIARPWPRHTPFKEATRREWTRFWPTLSPKTRSILERAEPLPGVTSHEWGSFIFYNLFGGKLLRDGVETSPLKRKLEVLASGDAAALARLKKDILQYRGLDFGLSNGTRMNREILCRELSSQDDDRLLLERGKLVRQAPDTPYCAGIPLSRPYSIPGGAITGVPFFHLAGARDTITPMWQMNAYIRGLPGVDHYRVVATEGGGGVSLYSFSDCKDGLWNAILSSPAGFSKAVEQCRARHRFDRIRPKSTRRAD